MRVLFHDNSLSIRGTTVALFDYAYYCKHMYGIDCRIIYNSTHRANSGQAISKFRNHFEVCSYSNLDEMQRLISSIAPNVFFVIKGGKRDGVLSNSCKNCVMAVAADTGPGDVHGDKWAYASHWLSQHCSGGTIPVVPHMINLPDVNGDLRNELSIPHDAIVFGRNGGYETFDLPWVKDCVRECVSSSNNIYFLFQFTEKFIDHPRVIHLGENADMTYKVRFINTCDAMLHARFIGESFGLSCGEFSVRNKPVITWNGSPERNHNFILKDKGIYFDDKAALFNILMSFDRNKYKSIDNNCYRDYLPDKVMPIFYDFYLKE